MNFIPKLYFRVLGLLLSEEKYEFAHMPAVHCMKLGWKWHTEPPGVPKWEHRGSGRCICKPILRSFMTLMQLKKHPFLSMGLYNSPAYLLSSFMIQ
jgi:hypothetical protein